MNERRWVLIMAMIAGLIVSSTGGIVSTRSRDAGAVAAPGKPFAVRAVAHAGAPGLPQGIAAAPLVETDATEVPAAPSVFRLDRMTLPPGASLPTGQAVGPLLFYVESGELTVTDELGIEGSYPAETQLVVPMNAVYALANKSAQPAVVLLLGLYPANGEPAAAPSAAAKAAAPVAAGATPVAGVIGLRSLFRAEVKEAIAPPVHLFLWKMTWQPGAALPEHIFAAPFGMIAQAGVLKIAGPSGIEGQLVPGRSVLFPAGKANHEHNDGKEPAVVLAASFTAAGQALMQSPNGTPIAVTASSGATPVAESASPVSASPVAESGSAAVFRGNAARTGVMPGPGPEGTPVLRWKITPGEIESSPAVAGGRVVVTSDSSSALAVALDEGTGAQLWTFTDGSNHSISSPAIVDGVVYLGSLDDTVYALDAKQGVQLWKFQTHDTIDSSPVVVSGIVYIGCTDGFVYAIDAKSGKELWQSDSGGAIFSSPAVADGRLYVANATGRVVALDAASGSELWRFEAGTLVNASPAVANGVVVVSDTSGIVHALSAAKGEEIWRYTGSTEIDGSAAVSNSIIVVGDVTGMVHGLDAATGNELWRTEVAGALHSSPVIVGTTVYILTNGSNGLLVCLDLATGKERWRFDNASGTSSIVFSSSPTVVDGFVFFGTPDGMLYAIGGSSGSNAVTPTPQPVTKGATVVVTAKDAVIRAAPSKVGVVLEPVAVGAKLTVIGDSEKHDGKTWWRVEDAASGVDGYISADEIKVS